MANNNNNDSGFWNSIWNFGRTVFNVGDKLVDYWSDKIYSWTVEPIRRSNKKLEAEIKTLEKQNDK